MAPRPLQETTLAGWPTGAAPAPLVTEAVPTPSSGRDHLSLWLRLFGPTPSPTVTALTSSPTVAGPTSLPTVAVQTTMPSDAAPTTTPTEAALLVQSSRATGYGFPEWLRAGGFGGFGIFLIASACTGALAALPLLDKVPSDNDGGDDGDDSGSDKPGSPSDSARPESPPGEPIDSEEAPVADEPILTTGDSTPARAAKQTPVTDETSHITDPPTLAAVDGRALAARTEEQVFSSNGASTQTPVHNHPGNLVLPGGALTLEPVATETSKIVDSSAEDTTSTQPAKPSVGDGDNAKEPEDVRGDFTALESVARSEEPVPSTGTTEQAPVIAKASHTASGLFTFGTPTLPRASMGGSRPDNKGQRLRNIAKLKSQRGSSSKVTATDMEVEAVDPPVVEAEMEDAEPSTDDDSDKEAVVPAFDDDSGMEDEEPADEADFDMHGMDMEKAETPVDTSKAYLYAQSDDATPMKISAAVLDAASVEARMEALQRPHRQVRARRPVNAATGTLPLNPMHPAIGAVNAGSFSFGGQRNNGAFGSGIASFSFSFGDTGNVQFGGNQDTQSRQPSYNDDGPSDGMKPNWLPSETTAGFGGDSRTLANNAESGGNVQFGDTSGANTFLPNLANTGGGGVAQLSSDADISAHMVNFAFSVLEGNAAPENGEEYKRIEYFLTSFYNLPVEEQTQRLNQALHDVLPTIPTADTTSAGSNMLFGNSPGAGTIGLGNDSITGALPLNPLFPGHSLAPNPVVHDNINSGSNDLFQEPGLLVAIPAPTASTGIAPLALDQDTTAVGNAGNAAEVPMDGFGLEAALKWAAEIAEETLAQIDASLRASGFNLEGRQWVMPTGVTASITITEVIKTSESDGEPSTEQPSTTTTSANP
ncbi:hypothetical protein GGI17_000744 [Coemansia sp. S146]|nr:hypothetical protein GGI17_000744 [Coemansia sp. S146]